MKIFLILSLIGLTFCQIDIEHPSLDYEFRRAQQELTWGHVFAEEFSVQNRAILSNELLIIESQIIESFMNAYADIKNHAIEVRRIMIEEFPETSVCKDQVRARWELQVTRYGQKLSQCLGVADGYIKELSSVLNDLHVESRAYSNLIPNSGIHTLAQLQIFDARDSLQQYINNRFRDIFFQALDRYHEFQDYVEEISRDTPDIIHQLTACFRSLPNAFVNESNEDLRSIEQCYQD